MIHDPLIYTSEYLRVRAVPTKHTSTYIFCHGKGQNGKQWQSLVEPLRKLGYCDHVAFIFPYFEFTNESNESYMRNAASLVRKIVAEEIVKGISADRIAVGGINEGFEVGLLSTIGDSTKIAGTAGITESLQYTNTIAAQERDANAGTPVFLIFHTAEPNNAAPDGILGPIGQPVGALVYDNERLNTRDGLVSAKVIIQRKRLIVLVLISHRTLTI
jgi:hypothetical protein